jgi:hypothetical protein
MILYFVGCVLFFRYPFQIQSTDTALTPAQIAIWVAAMEEHQTGNWIDVYNQGKEQ